MTIKKLGISGHRNIINADAGVIKQKLKEIISSISQNDPVFLSFGNAEGVDAIALELAQEMNKINPNFDFRQFAEDPVILANQLIRESDYLIVVWDGVYNGKEGGVSDLVFRAFEGNKNLIIYHLICPRLSNPNPIGRLLPLALKITDEKYNFLPFSAPYQYYTYHHKPNDAKLKSTITKNNIISPLRVTVLFTLLTVILGFIGFNKLEPDTNFLNKLFSAINLITFNSSVISNENIPKILDMARVLGLLTTVTGFLSLVYFVFRNWFIENWKEFQLNNKTQFVLVFGKNEYASNLISDLLQKENKVIWVSDGNVDHLITNRKNLIHFKGDIKTCIRINNQYNYKISALYLFDDVESHNIQCLSQMQKHNQTEIYIKVEQASMKALLAELVDESWRSQLHIFEPKENLARWINFHFPYDRFHVDANSKNAHIVICGFNALTQKMLLEFLRQAHFICGRNLKISLFCESVQEAKDALFNEFKWFYKDSINAKHQYELTQQLRDKLQIEIYPIESLCSTTSIDEDRLITIYQESDILSFYCCLESHYSNEQILLDLLPKLNGLCEEKLKNIQVLYLEGTSEDRIMSTLEIKLNAKAPHIPVIPIHRYSKQYLDNSIKNVSLDVLARRLAFWYNYIGQDNKHFDSIEAEKFWRMLSEADKESNRQAADHLWVKLRQIWDVIDINSGSFKFKSNINQKELEKLLEQLSISEHQRWSAHLLSNGFKSLYDKHIDKVKLEEQWSIKSEKEKLRKQKWHINLVPYKELSENDKNKDRQHIIKMFEMFGELLEN